jgi:hypothetical protein
MCPAYGTLYSPIHCLYNQSTLTIPDTMSDLPQTRSKRSLSPSAPSSGWNAATSTVRKTSRPNHNISSTVRDAIPELDARQLRDVIQQLVNFHPSSREKIADILPTIKPSQSPAVVKSTESEYFKRQVDWCQYLLSNQDWTRHPTVTTGTSCEIVAKAVEHELDIIMRKVQACKAYESAPRGKSSRDEYFVDAAIAILDIGLLLIERHNRLAKADHEMYPEHACECHVCPEDPDEDFVDGDVACQVYHCFETFSDIWKVIVGAEYGTTGSMVTGGYSSVQKRMLADICYATPDGSPHPLRVALSRYIDLPSLVPDPGPDAPNDINLSRWLHCEMRRLRFYVGGGEMPPRTCIPNPIPKVAALPILNVAGLSI